MGKKSRKKLTRKGVPPKRTPVTGPARVSAWLSDRAPEQVWRDVVAIVAGLLTVITTSGGLVYWLPWVQIGVLAGIVVGLLASSALRAGLGAVAGAGLGALVAPGNSWVPQAEPMAGALELIGLVTIAAVVAAGVRFVSQHDQEWFPDVALAVAMTVIIGNLWVTALTINTFVRFDPVNQEYIPSLNEQFRGGIPEAIARSDDALYFNVYSAMREGARYYESFDRFMVERQGGPASSVLNFRIPLIFYAWKALPGPQWIVWSFLVLVSGAVVSTVLLASRFVRIPLAVPAAGALASYFLVFPVQLVVFMQEPWAVALGIFSIVALVFSLGAQRWMLLASIGVVAAVLGTLIRETLVFVMVGGTLAAWYSPHTERRGRLGAWAIGWGVFLAAYAVHAISASGFTDPASSAGRFSPGGVLFVAGAIEYAGKHLGAGGPLPYVLAGLGVLGAFMLPRTEARTMVLDSTLIPLSSFMVLGNDALDAASGRAVNYWGAAVIPLLYACIPLAFYLLPGTVPEHLTARGTKTFSSNH